VLKRHLGPGEHREAVGGWESVLSFDFWHRLARAAKLRGERRRIAGERMAGEACFDFRVLRGKLVEQCGQLVLRLRAQPLRARAR
jgi:hypothetical protein